MRAPDLRERLQAAARMSSAPSSDFDLNSGTVLPEGRVLREAGVLVAVTAGARPQLLLTKRASGLKHHPGQIAFPGGKVDPGDDGAVGAALREAEEEIGLPRETVEVLGTLPPHETVTGYRVIPVLSWIRHEFIPVPEAGEVAEAFSVPFDHVTDPARFVIEARMWRGMRRRYYAVPWGPYYIWGATARMLRVLACRMQA
jgi:8-oxo-dGTP pyrophosphatase MutT (NUDIX family)